MPASLERLHRRLLRHRDAHKKAVVAERSLVVDLGAATSRVHRAAAHTRARLAWLALLRKDDGDTHLMAR
jgi:hypothetical protein